MAYILIALLIIGGVIFYLNSQKAKASETRSLPEDASAATTARKVQDNHYEGLRNMAFSVTPEQLGLSLPKDQLVVYGLIMDWEMDGATVTTVAYQSGDASMYLSTGGGVIGGGQHENVSSAAKSLISMAQSRVENATSTEGNPLPASNEVIFYFLTTEGKYAAKENMANFENRSSSWLPLFEEMNKVITAMRETSER